MMNTLQPEGCSIPDNATVIKLHLKNIDQLFDGMDPSPRAIKDLHPRVVEHIVASARQASSRAPLALMIQLDSKEVLTPAQMLEAREAIHAFFLHLSRQARHRLRLHCRRGVISLVIGLAVLASALVGSTFLGEGTIASTLRESLQIGGWVALWRPMEMFLYDWWPILGDRIFYYRLCRMPVEIHVPT